MALIRVISADLKVRHAMKWQIMADGINLEVKSSVTSPSICLEDIPAAKNDPSGFT